MIKFLFILLIILLLAMLLALRYRRQIQAGLQIWRMFRQVRQSSKPAEKPSVKQKINKSETLMRCARCGKWIAPSEAVKFGGNTIYCSTQCMEKAARLQSLADRQ